MVTTARIATICQSGELKSTIEANREHLLGLLDRAIREKPDLVCLPEAFSDSGVQLPLGETASLIASGKGILGTNREYLVQLATQLEALRIDDPYVQKLHAQISSGPIPAP